MTRPNPTETRLAQLEGDVVTLARLLLKTAGMTPALQEILSRASALETRPYTAPEQRTAA